MALVGLYLFCPSITNLILVLAITRMPAYMRVARAEALEVRERLFASRVFGASPFWILRNHILPIVTMATLTEARISMVGPRCCSSQACPIWGSASGPGRQLGPDGGAGTGLSGDRLVARLFPRPCRHAHHHEFQPPRQLVPHRGAPRLGSGDGDVSGQDHRKRPHR
ncbi:ABC transporter permease subunit [Devosia sp.]|uniref:ABC transporter permease subunit n=1 Tax=Devosia sp. TaxID=1871048 RepID=UPI002614E681|nr:ABC transporter permease subunit [Devosia sp.]